MNILPKAKPGDFRPISLLSNIGKLFESILEQRLREACTHILSPNQFGCRPGHSTSQALIRLLHANALVVAKSEVFALIAIDFSKACDRVFTKTMINKLITINTHHYLTSIIHQWLSNRSFTEAHKANH